METPSSPSDFIPEAGLLGLLEQEFIRRTSYGAGAEEGPEKTMLLTIRDRFARVISEAGDILDKESLMELCAQLDDEQIQIGAELGLNKPVLDRLTRVRQRIRLEVERRVGWSRQRREPWLRQGKPTMRTLNANNLLRERLGEKPLEVNGLQWITPEEMRQSHAIASLLGDVALADFWSCVDGSRFAFNDQTIQNLSSWIGDFEIQGGIPLEDIPVSLLTWPSMGSLRELLKNKMRDMLYSNFYRDSLRGVDPVIEELLRIQDRLTGDAHLQLVTELVDYFVEVADLTLPDNMKVGLGQGAEFPAKHQLIAMMEIMRQRQLLLADKTGGGKTATSIACFERLKSQGKAKRAIILAPAQVIGEWEKRLTDKEDGYFKEGRAPNVVSIRKKEGREQDWERAKSADYVLMSIEMCRRHTNGMSHTELAANIGADFMVLDEAHNVRNPKGADTDNIFSISQSEGIRNGHLVVSTATPIYNTVKDIAALIRLLNAGQDRIRHTLGVPPDLNFSDIQQLSHAISGNHTRLVRNLLMLRTLRREGNDCLPVGTRLIQEPLSTTTLSPLERAAYDAIRNDEFYSPTDKIRMLRELCTNPSEYCPDMTLAQSTKYQQLKAAVLRRLDEHAQNPSQSSGKILIGITRSGAYAKGITRDESDNNNAATSDPETYLIGLLRKELMEERNVPVMILDGNVSGNTPLHDRKTGEKLQDKGGAWMTKSRKIIAACRDHDGPAVLAIRTDVGGEGIDLSFMSDLDILCPPSVRSEYDQLIGRLWRRGQKHDVHIGMNVVQDTIEQGMHEFALRKQQIVEMLLAGKPLSHDEERILNDEIGRVQGAGYLAYEGMSPRRKLIWIFGRLFAQGKKRVNEILNAQGGKYGKDLAELYSQLDEYSYQGNNRRMLLALLEQHIPELKKEFGKKLEMADIAAGTLSVARHLGHRNDITVWSSDLTGAMLDMGKKDLPKKYSDKHVAQCAMDELPYENESKHIVFHSLALHYARNNSHKNGVGGEERMRAIHEMNRVLAPGGIAFLALPPFVIQDEKHFAMLCTTMEAYFGFEIIPANTGLATSVDRSDEDRFESYVLTMRKIDAPVKIETLPPEAWKILNFKKKHRVRKSADLTELNANDPLPKKKSHDASYHSEFVIGSQHLTFTAASQEAQSAEREHVEAKDKYERVKAGVQRLIAQHGSLHNVPLEKLLAFNTEEQLSAGAQTEKETYFRNLLLKHGSLDAIPMEKIAEVTSEVLVRAQTKKKGPFVCLARVDGKREKIGMYGKKFFYEGELSEHPTRLDAVRPLSTGRKAGFAQKQ